jgi:endonuclease YncB( thermonuclease family)
MQRKHASILALCLTILISNTIFLFSLSERDNLNSVIVSRVIDGDTFVTDSGEIIRLANINAPEKKSNLSLLSKAYLSSFINESIFLERIKIEKYGRTLGRIYTKNNTYINLQLVNLGLASKFLVDESELSYFSRAEENAIENNKGIWNKSSFKDCIFIDIHEREEFVIIKNICSPIDFSGWVIKDESRKEYKFKNYINKVLILHSSSGNDNSTDLFWNEEKDIWNNDRDTLYLFDKENNLVFHKSYGY